ncbi:DUF3253 domain-containing protein [Acidovorax sp. LjRoot194]|uniref:DUF3253 domain-containing protein n=1 Tax=Acidovorax sp. LjRoot194 TaxID=3342280 RepID=UPI003ED102B2
MTDADIEDRIFVLLALRQPEATICPSEVALSLVGEDGAWRDHMPHVRQVAQALAQHHRLRVTRGGVPVSATAPGGPIRLGLPRAEEGGAPTSDPAAAP